MAPVQFKDYYRILGVERSADQKEIKRAFRKKARENHPDVNRDDPGAEARFKDINEAYEVLSDTEKRQMYDRYGADWERYRDAGFDASGPAPGTGGQYQGSADFEQWFTGDSSDFSQSTTGGRSGNFSDFFNLIFGNDGGRAGFRQTARSIRGQDIEVEATVSLQEAFSGATRRLTVRTPTACDLCDGSGVVRGAMCPRCDGSGEMLLPRTLEVKIPQGVRTGSRVRVRGQGAPGENGGAPGDVYLQVKVTDDPQFERDGDNIRTIVQVPLYDAVLGGEVRVPTLSGAVMMTIPPETQSGKLFRLRGKGMPRLGNPDQRGDLLARVQVTIPTDLSPEEQRRFTELRNLRQ